MIKSHNFSEADTRWMQQAYELATQAAAVQEVPVGAVLVLDQQLIGAGFNQPISAKDPSAHAEIVAIRQAALKLNNYRLLNTTLYVTLEPCAMCAFALLHARVRRIVYGCPDPKTGALGGAIDLYGAHKWNHQIDCELGLLSDQCRQLLQRFFQDRR